jgi:hypothetical protein
MPTPDAELDELAAYFRSHGFHSHPRKWAAGNTVLVAAQPEELNGLVLYRRSAYAVLQDDGSWRTIVEGIETSETLSAEELRRRLSELMRSSDEQYQHEFTRRAGLVGSGT